MFIEFNFDTRQYTLRERLGGAVIAARLPAHETIRLLNAPVSSAMAMMSVARDAAYRDHVKRVQLRTGGEHGSVD